MLKAFLALFHRPTVASVLEQFHRTVDQLKFVDQYNGDIVFDCDIRMNELGKKRNDATAESLHAANVRRKILTLIEG